jgi:hypothetical protein
MAGSHIFEEKKVLTEKGRSLPSKPLLDFLTYGRRSAGYVGPACVSQADRSPKEPLSEEKTCESE